jgi:nucleotide-binding universal stress UspA family protein
VAAVTGTVVVGIDGSPGSVAALEFALRDAARRGARLRVLAAVRPVEYWASAYGPIPVPPTAAQLDDVAADVRRTAEQAAERLRLAVPVDGAAVHGAAGPALVDASAGADLLVVGHRGRGAVSSTLLGSVGLHCVLHAPCPVTVVRPVQRVAEAVRPGPVPATAPAVPAVP